MKDKIIVGSVEKCDLPQLKINNLHVRVDTGAKTSSLHVDNIETFLKHNERWVSFDLHPDAYNIEQVIKCDSKVYGQRKIKSSNGISEKRYVIQTLFSLGGQEWPIEITLTDRADMSYLMLLGREGMSDKLLVDPSKEYYL